MKLRGISSGNAAFTCPVALKRLSSAAVMFSHSAQPYGPHDHAAAHGRVIRQLGPQNELVVPLRIILRPRRQLQFGHFTWLFFVRYGDTLLDSRDAAL